MARTKKPIGDKCRWREDEDGNWHTDCENVHVVIEGTPSDNHMRFCCYCGANLKQKRHNDD